MNNIVKIAQTIADRLRRSSDILLLERLENSAYSLRATFLRRDYQKSREIHPSTVLSLGCVKLIKVDAAECCDIETKCKVKRTEERIPAPLRRNSLEPFVHVGSPYGSKYNYATDLQESLIGARRFDTTSPVYIYKDGYIYVFNTNAKEVVVKDPFEDPRLASEFNTCKQSQCSIEEDSFTPEDMIALIDDELSRKEGIAHARSQNSNHEANV